MARTVRVTGSIANGDNAVRFLKTAAGDPQTTVVDDLYLIARIARLAAAFVVEDCNWWTKDDFCLITKDGFSFNVREV